MKKIKFWPLLRANLVKIRTFLKGRVHFNYFFWFIQASGCGFRIEVYNLASTQTSANGFDLSYHQAPCSNAVVGDY